MSSPNVSDALNGVARGLVFVAAQDWVNAGKAFFEGALALVPVDAVKGWLSDADRAQADGFADAAEKVKFGP